MISLIYLFLAVLSLHCHVSSFLAAVSSGYSLAVTRGLPIMLAPLAVNRGMLGVQASVVAALGLSSCGSWALEHRLSSCGARS